MSNWKKNLILFKIWNPCWKMCFVYFVFWRKHCVQRIEEITWEHIVSHWSKLMMIGGNFCVIKLIIFMCYFSIHIIISDFMFFCWQLDIKIYGKHISWDLKNMNVKKWKRKKTFFEYNIFETNLKSKKNNNTYVRHKSEILINLRKKL